MREKKSVKCFGLFLYYIVIYSHEKLTYIPMKKAEFYTRVHKKMYILLLFTSQNLYMILSQLYLRFPQNIGHYYLNFSQNNIFFLIPTLIYTLAQ